MAEYMVSIEVETREPLQEEPFWKAVDSVFAVSGAASGEPGGCRFGATITLDADSLLDALTATMFKVTGLVPGRVVEVQAMPIEEFERHPKHARWFNMR